MRNLFRCEVDVDVLAADRLVTVDRDLILSHLQSFTGSGSDWINSLISDVSGP